MRWMVLALALSGCVMQSTYDELKAQYDAEVQRAKGLEEALAAEQAKVAKLEQEKSALIAEKANLLKDQSSLQSSVQELETALQELEKRKREAEARIAEYRSLLDRFKPLMDAGRLRVKIADGRMVVELATDVLFDSGKATLSDEGKEAVAEVAALLAAIPEKRYQVEGHTDDVPIKNARFPSNWELAWARANTVVQTMIDAGMPPTRVSGASFGEFKPTTSNETDEGKRANRRIEIVLVPDLTSLPGFEELKKLGEG